MSKPTSFHVRHDLHPSFTYELLMMLQANLEGQTEDELQLVAQTQGFALRQRKDYGKLINSLEDLGVVEKKNKLLALTEKGRLVSEVSLFQRQLLPELIHFMYYTLFDTNPALRFSWSYRTVCNHLWMTSPSTINRDRLVNVVVQSALEQFNETSISFSTQSVMGIMYWVVSLHPTCIDAAGKVFSRRLYCPVETFILALQHIHQRYRGDGLSVLLTPEIRQEVCQICLLVPEAFHEMLDQAETSFDCVQVQRERGERLVMTDLSWDFLKE
jgi:hypothetical protein